MRQAGRLAVVAHQADGCSDTIYLTIPLCIVPADNVWIPNAFSPNGDEYNNGFAPISKYIASYTMSIYTRWGEQVYATSDSQRAWDGSYRNTAAPQGVYFYQIELMLVNGQRLYKNGTITLLR